MTLQLVASEDRITHYGAPGQEVVHLPTQLGGKVLDVLGDAYEPCPLPGHQHEARVLRLERGWQVVECGKFLWFKPKKSRNG